MLIREFVCADCKATVFTFSPELEERTRCFPCETLRRMKLDCTPEQIAALREILGYEPPGEE